MAASSQAPRAEPGVSLSFDPEFSAYPARSTATLTFAAHLVAPAMEDDDCQRSVVSLSAVLDKSGSMTGNKISLVKRTCDFMMQQLSGQDKLGVVQYDSDVEELLKLARTSEAFKREAKIVVERMDTGTCTNLSGGLFKGVEQQQRNRYIDYVDGPAAPSGADNQPLDSPPSLTSSSLTDTGSEMSNFEVIEAAVPLDAVEGLPECAAEEEEEEEQVQVQAPVRAAMPVRAQQVQQPSQQQRGVFQRMAQMFRGGRRSNKAHGCKAGEVASLLQKGTAPKGLELEADAVRSVFLFTDGLANEGLTDPNKLVETLQKMLDKSPRVRVYTFGYGSDHSPDLLQRIAAAGSGTYYFIENEESIPTAFADALGGLLSVAAQNVCTEFEPAPGVSVSHVHTTFKETGGSNGARTISVGDLFSEEAKDILFDVTLPALSCPEDDFTVGTLRVSYLDVAGSCVRSKELRCTVGRWDESRLAGLEPSSHVTLQKARITTAQALQEARREADAGNYEESRRRLHTSLKLMQDVQSKAKGDKKYEALSINLVEDLSEAISNMQDHNTYSSKGSKIMCSKAMGHMSQKSSALEAESQWADERGGEEAFTYANKSQMQMRRKAKAWFA